jgi:hypothetical protein
MELAGLSVERETCQALALGVRYQRPQCVCLRVLAACTMSDHKHQRYMSSPSQTDPPLRSSKFP